MEIKVADVAELVDARDLKSLDGNVVWVRVPPPAPELAESRDASPKADSFLLSVQLELLARVESFEPGRRSIPANISPCLLNCFRILGRIPAVTFVTALVPSVVMMTPIRRALESKETATMTAAQKLTGIAVFAFAICGVLLSVRTIRPPVLLAGANLAETSRHSCFDMNGKAFEWGFSNVPFAATCDAKPGAPQ